MGGSTNRRHQHQPGSLLRRPNAGHHVIPALQGRRRDLHDRDDDRCCGRHGGDAEVLAVMAATRGEIRRSLRHPVWTRGCRTTSAARAGGRYQTAPTQPSGVARIEDASSLADRVVTGSGHRGTAQRCVARCRLADRRERRRRRSNGRRPDIVAIAMPRGGSL